MQVTNSDITAIVLTMGERTTQAAIDSLYKQSMQPGELVIVENISPFHKALNYGVNQIKTEYFLQVDADMVLDKDCILNLKNNMEDRVGIALGQLRDPLMGAESGIKLFRTECFIGKKFKNTVSPDTDLYQDIMNEGWEIRRALYLSREQNYGKYWFTFGDHIPDYTPLYVYRRYCLLGRRYRYRKDLQTLIWRLERLSAINHKHSIIAQISMCHGIFTPEETDQLDENLYLENKDFKVLCRFLNSEKNNRIHVLSMPKTAMQNPSRIFSQYYGIGVELKQKNNVQRFLRYLQLLNNSLKSNDWIAKIALCHGLLSYNNDKNTIDEKFGLLNELL